MNTSAPSARLRPFRPQPFGRYTLLSHLATGGMGEIYLARLEGAQGFEKLCVIKKILPQLAEDKEFVDRFVGEARTLVKLHHGSIAQVLDMGLHEGDAYMALEYVDGKDLRKVAGRVRDKGVPLPLTFVLFVMGRVLDALAYAHRKRDDDEKEINLVHRDISPQNILISYEGEVKVIDFGLAKSRLSAAKTNPSIILGKFLYMSPEQAKHQQVDRRSDLYAVGLCLYELITGKNPFDSVHPGELMSAVANPRITPLLEVESFTPPPVAQLVMKALAVDPAQRFQTAEEFRGRLVSVLMEIDPSAGPESVSRFMRDVFSVEFQSERKLLAQLKDAQRMGELPLPPRSELDTDPGARFPPPSLPAKTIKLDPPSQPLSFQPTPRSRPGGAAQEEETRPGVPLVDTRPAVSFEALDAAARARVRPSLASTSPNTETVTVEVRTDPHDRVPPLPTAAPASPRAPGPTVEVPIPYVPSAAIPPGAAPPAPTAGTARTLEAPRAPVPPPPPPLSGAALKSSDAPRGAIPPPPPPASAPAPKLGDAQRAGPPPPLPASASAVRNMETQRVSVGPPPPPAAAHAPESEDAEIDSLFLEPTGPMGQPSSSESYVTPPNPIPAVREASPPPVPDEELPQEAAEEPEPSGSSRERSRGASPPALELALESLDAVPEPSRRGLDDTHPSYQMASSKPAEDTQPRVVLDEAAFRGQQEPEEQVVVGGMLEDSAANRTKPPRRQRGSAGGLPAVSRGASNAARGPSRPLPAEDSESPSEDSDPVGIEIEDGGEAARDPRDDTRKTPIPTRPGERRTHREDARRAAAAAAAPEKKRSWLWLMVSFMLLVVAGAAVVVLLPQLELMLNLGAEPKSRPPPAVPIRPQPAPSGTPGAVAPAGTAAPGVPPPEPVVPPAAAEAVAPVTKETAEEAAVDDDMLVPLPNASPPAPAKKASSSKASKKGPRSKESAELQKEWAQVRTLYARMTEEQGCENRKLALVCRVYEDVKTDVTDLGDGFDPKVLDQVRKLRKQIQQQIARQ
ncbi:serine/threonine-protein kinase [Hyalangium versicolor]|uniref:serine/threonine-protein kinase n=1 Tax=Hyalangium versicolor TaxID=2861190 RepID=UPI001CCA1875|nr:serine/threonine-protein kinase [Hyalangium versicolor]